MPRGDRTGPSGEGPMTGRAEGYCGGNTSPGSVNSPGLGRWSRRPGGSRGRGRGFRNRFYATGLPFSAYTEPELQMGADEERATLKSESGRLRSVLETIEKRLQQLDEEKT